MFEYAISRGEGTLIAYGTAGYDKMVKMIDDLGIDRRIVTTMPDVVLANAETTLQYNTPSPDCETGE